MPGGVLADRPALKAVALVGPDKVHAAKQRGLVIVLTGAATRISSRAYGMGPGRQRRVEDVVVAPDLVGAGSSPGHKGHARWRAQRRGGVRIGKAHALAGQAVEVRGAHQRVAVAAEVEFAVLVGEDEEDIGMVHGWVLGGTVKQRDLFLQNCEDGVQAVMLPLEEELEPYLIDLHSHDLKTFFAQFWQYRF